MIESFNTQPLPNVIPAYVYDQYSDDENVQGFFEVLNAMAQGYLDWFNQTPLLPAPMRETVQKTME